MNKVKIRSMKSRIYEMVSIDLIDVINSRNRDEKQFAENVRSIKDVGLYKPIIINKRNFNTKGRYELVCGEGRLLAHKEIGKKLIKAEIVDIDIEQHQIMTLAENIARIPPQSIEYGYAIKEMRDRGMSLPEISNITGHSQSYLQKYITLVKNGEEKLIKGVEEGSFPITLALSVATSDNASVQHLLMSAFEEKLINSNNVSRIRRIIDSRLKEGKLLLAGGKRPSAKIQEHNLEELKKDMQRITTEKMQFVNQTEKRELRIFRLTESLRIVLEDNQFKSLLNENNLLELPELSGKYNL